MKIFVYLRTIELEKSGQNVEIANGRNIAKIWYWGYIKDIW